jgi:hypothetical protein
MTENTTTTGESEIESESEIEEIDSETEPEAETETAFVSVAPANEEQASLPEELIEIDDDSADEDDVPGTGAISGGFGFAGLALAIVSLTTNWTSGIVVSHSQYAEEVKETSTATAQTTLSMYENGWHTQGYWALAFALGAVLFGTGAILSPSILLSGRTPGWAKAGATAAIIVGLVAALLAILTVVGVFGGNITAPATAS